VDEEDCYIAEETRLFVPFCMRSIRESDSGKENL
jgi:hypothetical protein